MKDSSKNAIIIILIITVVVLSIILIQAQRTIVGQRTTIASQQDQISELKTENAKLSNITPERIMNDAKEIIKEEGAGILQSITERAIQEVQSNK